MINAQGLTKYFDDFLAVDNVTFHTAKGHVLVVLGPNGAGKTTTVRMLTSILQPSSGTASIAGYDVVGQASKVRASVGVLTEQHGLYNRMNPVEYLEFYGNLYGMDRSESRKRMNYLLEEFGLANATKKRLGEFSKGMRQKLALTRAMLHDPPVLLLDEPTSAMDPESARMVRDAIIRLKSNDRTILLCTHNLAEAEELADQIAIIQRGRILFNEIPENLKRQLLGASQYEAHFSDFSLKNGWKDTLPPGVTCYKEEANTLYFEILEPTTTNPVLLNYLIQLSLPLLSFQPVPRSLEQAYLHAIQNGNKDAQ